MWGKEEKSRESYQSESDSIKMIMMGCSQIVVGMRVSMAKSWDNIKAEQPTVPHLSAPSERSILGSGPSFSRRRNLVFIVNPQGELPSLSLSLSLKNLLVGFRVFLFNWFVTLEFGAGANGSTGKQWKKLLPYLRSRLGSDCNVSSFFPFLFLIFLSFIFLF